VEAMILGNNFTQYVDQTGKNELLQHLMDRNISIRLLSALIEKHNLFQITFMERPFYFKIEPHSNSMGINYEVTSTPRTGLSDFIGFNWQGVLNNFKNGLTQYVPI
jgi:hypothetical protein